MLGGAAQQEFPEQGMELVLFPVAGSGFTDEVIVAREVQQHLLRPGLIGECLCHGRRHPRKKRYREEEILGGGFELLEDLSCEVVEDDLGGGGRRHARNLASGLLMLQHEHHAGGPAFGLLVQGV